MLHPFVMAFATCVATAIEQRRLLPVDAMVPDPLFTSTHAITIDAAPDQVWPWIAQMGDGRAGWYMLLAFEPERYLVLGWRAPGGEHVMTWAFVLEEIEHSSTRLLVRVRVRAGARVFGLPWWAANYLASVIHFPMQRKQLIGIARRAELTMSRSSAFKAADRQAAGAR